MLQTSELAAGDLTANDYSRAAMTHAIYPTRGTGDLQYPTLGLCGEAGEIANQVKKIYRDHAGSVPTALREKLIDEAGDVLWYIAALACELGVSLGEVARRNLHKLDSRASRGAIGGSGDGR